MPPPKLPEGLRRYRQRSNRRYRRLMSLNEQFNLLHDLTHPIHRELLPANDPRIPTYRGAYAALSRKVWRLLDSQIKDRIPATAKGEHPKAQQIFNDSRERKIQMEMLRRRTDEHLRWWMNPVIKRSVD